MTGKSLFAYQPERDFAIASLGIVKDQKKFRHSMIAGNLKVEFEDEEVLKVHNVTDSHDQPLQSLDQEQVKRMLRKVMQARQWLPAGGEKPGF